MATKVVVTQDPNATYTADDDILVTAQIQDAWDNVVTTGPASTATIALTLTNPNGAVLTGTASKAAIAGEASFTVNVRKVGTTYGLSVTSSGLTSDSTTAFNVTPGALASFTVKDSAGLAIPNQTAGVAFTIKATAYDAWGNVKTNYGGGATVSGTLGKAFGITTGAGDDNDRIYGAFGTWLNGVATASVTGFKAETGRTITVSHGTPSGTSSTFDVIANVPNSIFFKTPNNDVTAFDFGPISTKFGTPIYSLCIPPTSGTNPCATTLASSPSIAVRTLVRDLYGNPVLNANVVIKRNLPTGTVVGNDNTDASGVADFADSLSIANVGDYVLSATVGAVTPVTAPIAIVNELKACTSTTCKNNVGNGLAKLQKTFGKITATTGTFDAGSTHVRLSTQFVTGHADQPAGLRQHRKQEDDRRCGGHVHHRPWRRGHRAFDHDGVDHAQGHDQGLRRHRPQRDLVRRLSRRVAVDERVGLEGQEPVDTEGGPTARHDRRRRRGSLLGHARGLRDSRLGAGGPVHRPQDEAGRDREGLPRQPRQ